MAETPNTPLEVGAVALVVHDLDRVGRFYEEVVGLDRLAAEGDAVALGAGDTVLLRLRRDTRARVRSPREAGLFHTAFLLPARADLGRWAVDAAQRGVPIQGMSDHVVSEAIYLGDPEGNGIEIYADRPREGWRRAGDMIVMSTDPLDVDGLMRAAAGTRWEGAPAGTRVGHVHLQVGAIPAAEAFYAGLLGFTLTARYPGGSFYGAGGYHHHIGTNIWNSRNAGVRAEPSTGLADVGLVAGDETVLAAIADRAGAAGVPVERTATSLAIRDPWGTHLTIGLEA